MKVYGKVPGEGTAVIAQTMEVDFAGKTFDLPRLAAGLLTI